MTGRIPGLEPPSWSPAVRRALAPTVGPVAELEDRDAGPEGGATSRPLNILTVIAHQPRLLDPFLGWASALVLEGVLPRRDHELLALRAAANCGSPFEWGHHAVYARAAGLTDDEVNRVAAGPDADGWEPGDADLLRAADELQRGWTISDPTWRRLTERYDEGALVELCFVVGQYTMLSMLANAAGVEVEPGYDPLPAPRG
jgi:alkylhydroperoxidase family enzyme